MRQILWGGFIGVVLLTGCQAPGPEVYVPLSTTVNGMENHDLRVLLDARIQYSVSCPAIEQHTTPDGNLEITAHLRNREDHPIQVQVNCVFRDARGATLSGDETPFQNVALGQNDTEQLHFVSRNFKARRYTICVRKVQ